MLVAPRELVGRIARLRPEVVSAIKAAVSAMAPAAPRAAFAVENDGLMATMGPDVTRRAHELLAAGIQTREGELEHERIVNSI